jgi:hypothetical protein
MIITKKVYTELVNAMRKLATMNRKKKMRFIKAGFGVLREDFGNGSSVDYVTNLRKSWRT